MRLLTTPKRLGFLISVFIHGSIVAFFFTGQLHQSAETSSVVTSLSLSMFKPLPTTKQSAPLKPPQPLKAVQKKAIIEKPAEIPEPTPEVVSDAIPQTKPAKDYSVATDEINDTTESIEQVMSEPPSPSASNASDTPPPPALEPGLIASLEAQYKQALRKAIESRKFYPKQARRLKREGSVILDFTITSDGHIFDIQITQSSGSRALDKAATQAVRKLGRFEPIPKELAREEWSLSIPMDYSLM